MSQPRSFNLNLLECKLDEKKYFEADLYVLISTYWNVNWLVAAYAEQAGFVLISTYWNVNYVASVGAAFATWVLISTYWNVNFRHPRLTANIAVVLISTYWNVNRYWFKHERTVTDGFNLNLLECKFDYQNCFQAPLQSVLISTYWNVNCLALLLVMRFFKF